MVASTDASNIDPTLPDRALSVGIIFPSLGPYHVARINALRNTLVANGMSLVVFIFSEFSETYEWKSATPDNLPVVPLSDKPPKSVFDAFRVFLNLIINVKRRKINVLMLPSYSPFPNFLCFLAAKLLGKKSVLMCESWVGSESESLWKSLLKSILIPRFDAALVGGSPHVEYQIKYGQRRENVFVGYDVVDNNHFLSESHRWVDSDSSEIPASYLPKRYFLNLGRFVKKKNLASLLRSYSIACKEYPDNPVSLVLVGSGDQEPSLRELAKNLKLTIRNGTTVSVEGEETGEVVFFPFQQIEMTPLFFSRCEAFILPSLTEEWGLVVNEALACGAPVVVSNNVGSANDLVRPGENGYVFDPRNIEELAEILTRFVRNPELRESLASKTIETITPWSPELFGVSSLKAILASSPRTGTLSFGVSRKAANQ